MEVLVHECQANHPDSNFSPYLDLDQAMEVQTYETSIKKETLPILIQLQCDLFKKHILDYTL